jgi:hypothetical protein
MEERVRILEQRPVSVVAGRWHASHNLTSARCAWRTQRDRPEKDGERNTFKAMLFLGVITVFEGLILWPLTFLYRNLRSLIVPRAPAPQGEERSAARRGHGILQRRALKRCPPASSRQTPGAPCARCRSGRGLAITGLARAAHERGLMGMCSRLGRGICRCLGGLRTDAASNSSEDRRSEAAGERAKLFFRDFSCVPVQCVI